MGRLQVQRITGRLESQEPQSQMQDPTSRSSPVSQPDHSALVMANPLPTSTVPVENPPNVTQQLTKTSKPRKTRVAKEWPNYLKKVVDHATEIMHDFMSSYQPFCTKESHPGEYTRALLEAVNFLESQTFEDRIEINPEETSPLVKEIKGAVGTVFD